MAKIKPIAMMGNLYAFSLDGMTANSELVFDRAIKRVKILAYTLDSSASYDQIELEFPSIYGHPLTIPAFTFFTIHDACDIYVEEYGEFTNENYWESREIPQA